jgi:hypothetical protein
MNFKENLKERKSTTSTEEVWLKSYKQSISKISSNNLIEAPFVYMDRRLVSQMLTRIELFKLISDVQGSIVECGVHRANSLFLYYHLSSIFEPYAFTRKIIGFDTFEGFPSISTLYPDEVIVGHMRDTNYESILEWINIQDSNRPLGHIEKLELVQGDALVKIDEYLNLNPHLIIALLYLDFDIYEPTKVALEKLFPLIPKGGVIGFDELNQKKWKGETIAFKEVLGTHNFKLKKFSFDPHVTYFVKE